MEEDVEIELLLKSNEELLMVAASTSQEENYVQGKKNDQETISASTVKDTKQSESTQMETTLCVVGSNKTSKETIDEVQELLDDKMASYIAKTPSRFVLPMQSIDSDEESISSRDSYQCDVSDDADEYFINEILADDELNYRGRSIQQIRKQVGNKCKQSRTIIELTCAQKLILKRDDLLTNLEAQLQKELFENEEKQKHIRDSIFSLSLQDNKKIREPSFTRCFFKKFGMPYFEDMSGFTPPPNEDHKQKLERGELIVTSIPKVTYWTKIHKERLLDAIKDTLMEEHSEKLIREINKLKDKLCFSENENNELVEKITKLQDDLRSIKSKSYVELIGKEKTDREYDWMKYSVTVFDGVHSPEECRRFWNVYLKPTVNKSSWDEFEDCKLFEIAERMQHENWDTIAEMLGTGRTAYQCLIHYQTRIHPKKNFSSGRWTEEEDNRLLEVVSASRIGDFIPWSKVCTYMIGRTHSQIYNRWNYSLDPKLVKGKFTEEEDLLIMTGIQVFGANFKELSSLMSSRSSVQIRERYERHLIHKTTKIGTFSLAEDQKLLNLVEKHGEHNWVAIAKEMKDRTRTQVRQRYNFIKRRMKTKPGWTVSKVKRRHCHNITKALLKTTKHVDRLKKQVNTIEDVFKLSKLEKDTFRLEKLKELKDKVLMKKYKLTRKKQVFSDSSEVNRLLLEYFSYSQLCPTAKPKVDSQNNYGAQINEILLMAKYFGHELQLPEREEEILENKNLSYNLKCILRETIDSRTGGPVTSSVEEHSKTSNCEANIDCAPLHGNEDIFMSESWHTPPFDVKSLNFSEFFKRTIFDYSYGMHKDIWDSRLKRLSAVHCQFGWTLPQQSKELQPFTIPPNQVTTEGFKSLLLSMARLKLDNTDKGFAGTLYKRVKGEEVVKKEEFVHHHSLDLFQETMISLFTWPRVLSLTSISSTPVSKSKAAIVKRNTESECQRKLVTLLSGLNEEDENSCKFKKRKRTGKEKRARHVLKQKQNCLHEVGAGNKGIGFKRKIKIEHLVPNNKSKQKKSVLKSNSKNLPRSDSGLQQRIMKSITNNDEVSNQQSTQKGFGLRSGKILNKETLQENEAKETTHCDIESAKTIVLRSPKITYQRPKKTKKRALTKNDASETSPKKIKKSKNAGKKSKKTKNSSVEHCLESPEKVV